MQKKLSDMFEGVYALDDMDDLVRSEEEKKREKSKETVESERDARPSIVLDGVGREDGKKEKHKQQPPASAAPKNPTYHSTLNVSEDTRIRSADVADCMYRVGNTCAKRKRPIALDCREDIEDGQGVKVACWERMVCRDYTVQDHGGEKG